MSMKELSIKEKAKAYDRALEIAKAWHKLDSNDLSNDDLETLFPVLKESEDEKVRKELIRAFKSLNTIKVWNGIERTDIIAWLEKQEGCEYIKKDWLEHIKQSWYKEGFIDGKYTPKELTINDATTLNELIDFLENGTVKLQHDLTLYANWLKTQFSPNEKQGEQKPAWSEEDEKEYKYVLRFVDNILNNCGNKKDYEHSKRCYDWLKSLKEKIKKEAV